VGGGGGRGRRRPRVRALLRVEAGQEAGEPGALDRVGRSDHAIEQLDLVLGEGRGTRNRGQLISHCVLPHAGSHGWTASTISSVSTAIPSSPAAPTMNG